MLVTMRRIKGDQEGRGQVVPISMGTSSFHIQAEAGTRF